MSAKHTPTPWTVIADMAGCSTIVRNIFGLPANVPYEIASHVGLADAEFIADACNAYDANQKTIAALLEALKRYTAFDGRYGSPDGNLGERMDGIDIDFNLRNLHKQAKEAIAQAEAR